MAGLFAGMICLGLSVDQIGRKWGSVSTASIMFVGKPLARPRTNNVSPEVQT